MAQTVNRQITTAASSGVGDKLVQAVKNTVNKGSTAEMRQTADSILPSATLAQNAKDSLYGTTDTVHHQSHSTDIPGHTSAYTANVATGTTAGAAGEGGTVGAGGTGVDGGTGDGGLGGGYTGGYTGGYSGGTTAKKTTAKTGTGNVSPYTLQSYQAQEDQINSLYDAQKEAQLLALENAYNLSREEAEYAASKLPETYQTQANQVDTRAMQARQNFNEWAAGQGLNVGAGSQAALAMSNQRNSDIAAINRAQADAQAEAQRNLATMQQQYQNAVSEAIAQNQYDRAAALLKEYQTAAKSAVETANAQAQLDYQAKVNYANTLAKAGDYSGYKALGYTSADIAKLRSATRRSGGGTRTTATTATTINEIPGLVSEALANGSSLDEIQSTISSDPSISASDKLSAAQYINQLRSTK